MSPLFWAFFISESERFAQWLELQEKVFVFWLLRLIV